MSKKTPEEPTIDEELAPILDAMKLIGNARDKIFMRANAITERAVNGAALLVMPLEDVSTLVTLTNAVVTLENVNEALESAFASDLDAVGYRRPAGEKNNGTR